MLQKIFHLESIGLEHLKSVLMEVTMYPIIWFDTPKFSQAECRRQRHGMPEVIQSYSFKLQLNLGFNTYDTRAINTNF